MYLSAHITVWARGPEIRCKKTVSGPPYGWGDGESLPSVIDTVRDGGTSHIHPTFVLG